MTIVLDGTSGITTPSYGGTDTAEYLVPVTSFKNRIINGAMMIDQRNAGAAISAATLGAGGYTVDRFFYSGSQSAKFSAQQNQGSVTPPSGFVNYLGLTVASAVTVGASDYFLLSQRIEGLNVADLGFGSATASSVTLSFKVYTSLTGTHSGAILNNAANRSYPFTFTVSSANTWTNVSITIAGDTSGTWLTNSSTGIEVRWNLGSGSSFSAASGSWAAGNYVGATGAVSVVGTSGATFYITGVQLEKGSTATSFDYRPYGTELALCQRYYEIGGCAIYAPTASGFQAGAQVQASALWKVTKRAAPTSTVTTSSTTITNTPVVSVSDTVGASVYGLWNGSSASYIGFSCTVIGSAEL